MNETCDYEPDKDLRQRVDAIAQRFEEAWHKGGRTAIHDFLPEDGPFRLGLL